MEWKLGLPTEEGMYLKSNPVMQGTTCGKIWITRKGDGDLYSSRSDGTMGEVRLDKISSGFLWFGPIPMPSKELKKAGVDIFMNKGE